MIYFHFIHISQIYFGIKEKFDTQKGSMQLYIVNFMLLHRMFSKIIIIY